MINEIRVKVNELVHEELERSYKKEDVFHSPHEAYAVLLEEIEEASDELDWIEDHIERCWDGVKNNSTVHLECSIMHGAAIRGACELIQVAAMCKKWMESEEAKYEGGKSSESSANQ